MNTFLKQILAVILCSLSIQVFAAPISGGVVYGFSWNGDGIDDPVSGLGFADDSAFQAVDPGASPWTFNGEGVFEILDLQTLEDQFTVYDKGVLLGVSSVPGGGTCGLEILGCYGNPDASYGSFSLAAGDHSITIFANGLSSGAGVFRYSPPSEVPLPAAAWFFGSALLGLGALRRKRS